RPLESDPRVRRGSIYWVELPEGRRPAVIVTRTQALGALTRVLVAPCTTTLLGLPSRLLLGPDQGLPAECEANCDALVLVQRRMLGEPIGHTGDRTLA